MFINIKYQNEGIYGYKTNRFEVGNEAIITEDFRIENIKDGEIKILLSPTSKMTIEEFSLELTYCFGKKDKIFLNGYQSWTDTREVGLNHKDKAFHPLLKPTINKYKFKQYGDYNFYKAQNRKGIFHSTNYSYIKNEKNETFFIGSLNDNKAFSFIEFDTRKNKIYVKKDLKGKSFDKREMIIELFIKRGNKEELIDEYFTLMNIEKRENKILRGWTSWYNYYEDITEEVILKNLNNFEREKVAIDYFQIDDGYQNAVGDWLLINSKFPRGMKYLADKTKKLGYKPGIWLAPFSAEKKSDLVKNHPDWILKDENGEFVYGGSNWSSFYALDIYNNEFRTYLKEVFNTLINDWGYELFKLDFLYSACLLPRKDKTRAEVMSDAMDLLRELVGEKEILACGVPIYSSWGKVDYCRVGCDIGLDWDDKFFMKYFHRERISTKNAIINSINRFHMDAHCFYNDPDVFLLRDDNIHLTKHQKETLFWVNNLFGTLVFTSDDISKYVGEQKEFYMNSFKIKTKEILAVKEFDGVYKVQTLINNEKMVFLINLKNKVQNFDGRLIQAYETLYFKMEE